MNNLNRALQLSLQNAARNEDASLLEAQAMSLQNAARNEEAQFVQAQAMSRQNAEEDLYEDIRAQMAAHMVGKPHARRRIIAVAGLDTILSMGGDDHVRVVRDEIMGDIYSDIPVQMDPVFAEADHIMAEFGDDALVDRLMAIHAEMAQKEKEEEEAAVKAIRNAMNVARAAAAPAPAPAPPANNRRTLAAKRAAFFEKKKEGGSRRRNRVTRRKRRAPKRKN